MFDDLSLFVTIVEAGSLAGAAARERLPAATVTRRLQALEHALGYRLLNRSARKLTLTAEGEQYYEQCRPLIAALRQATQKLDAELDAIAGHIRVLAPVNLASGILGPAWSGFMQRHPDVTLELSLSNAMQDLAGIGADLAIRVGELADSSLTQKRLGATGLVLAASPAYLERAGVPADAAALADHALIVAEPLRIWHLRAPGGADATLTPNPRARTNEMRLAVSMAEAGLGILLCPLVQCHDALDAGRLTALLPGWLPPARPIYAVWPQQRYLPARVKALLDYLAAFIAAEPLLNQP